MHGLADFTLLRHRPPGLTLRDGVRRVKAHTVQEKGVHVDAERFFQKDYSDWSAAPLTIPSLLKRRAREVHEWKKKPTAHRDGDFHGQAIHDTLLTDQEILAAEEGISPATIGVPDLAGGTQRPDVRFVHFGNVVIELLQYRDATQPSGTGHSFAEPRDHMSPAYPRSMHICFHIRDDVDPDKFIADLDAESARRGMTQVKANRVVTVRTEAARRSAQRIEEAGITPDHRIGGHHRGHSRRWTVRVVT